MRIKKDFNKIVEDLLEILNEWHKLVILDTDNWFWTILSPNYEGGITCTWTRAKWKRIAKTLNSKNLLQICLDYENDN
jgi:hypothetical protein